MKLEHWAQEAAAFGHDLGDALLVVNSDTQRLLLLQEGLETIEYVVSTASAGLGEQEGSFQTPRGWHRIAERIGAGATKGTSFSSREPTGEVLHHFEHAGSTDGILSRILWLEGLEAGQNQGGSVDSHARYIYLHGTNQEHLLGTAASKGCIRLGNDDIIDLFLRIEGQETRCVIV